MKAVHKIVGLVVTAIILAIIGSFARFQSPPIAMTERRNAGHQKLSRPVNFPDDNSRIKKANVPHTDKRTLNSLGKDKTPVYLHSKLSLSQDDVDGVGMFVFFVGFRRSGHSIIGSLMDAHPNMIIAHEFMLFQQWSKSKQLHNKNNLFNAILRESHNEATKGRRASTHNKKGYTLSVGTGWQGRFENLQVIGEKSGQSTTMNFFNSRDLTSTHFYEIAETVGVPVRAIFVVRNPYDMIATETLVQVSEVKGVRSRNYSKENKLNNSQVLTKQAAHIITQAEAVQEMISAWGLTTLEIHSEDFISDPKSIMSDVCKFVEVNCTKEYLEQCYNKTFREVSRTRESVYWPRDVQDFVDFNIHKFPFFRGYTLEGDSYRRTDKSEEYHAARRHN